MSTPDRGGRKATPTPQQQVAQHRARTSSPRTDPWWNGPIPQASDPEAGEDPKSVLGTRAQAELVAALSAHHGATDEAALGRAVSAKVRAWHQQHHPGEQQRPSEYFEWVGKIIRGDIRASMLHLAVLADSHGLHITYSDQQGLLSGGHAEVRKQQVLLEQLLHVTAQLQGKVQNGPT